MTRLFLISMLLIGCRDKAPPAERAARASGPSSVTRAIGPAGGVVEIPDGPRLEIPAGALTTERTFSITRLGEQYPVGAYSEAFAFSPRDVVFERPASVSFPVPDSLLDVDIYWLVNGGTHHDRLGAEHTTGRLQANVVRLGTAYLAPRAGGRAVWGTGAKPGRILAIENHAGRRAPCESRVYADGTFVVADVRDGEGIVLLETVSDVTPVVAPPRC